MSPPTACRNAYALSLGADAPPAMAKYLSAQLSLSGLSPQRSGAHLVISVPSPAALMAAERLQLFKTMHDGSRTDFTVAAAGQFAPQSDGHLFTHAERAAIATYLIHAAAASEPSPDSAFPFQRGDPLVLTAQRVGVVDAVTPLHVDDVKMQVAKDLSIPFVRPESDAFRNYFGDRVALYFRWMHLLNLWLVPPALVGLFLFVTRPAEVTVANSWRAPLFGILMPIWGAVFVKLWARQEAALAYASGGARAVLELSSPFAADDTGDVRPDFYGDKVVVSPVTGKRVLWYSPVKRALKIAATSIVTALLLFAALAVMIASLNLQGYMRDASSPLHIPFLAQFAEAGEVFDPAGMLFIVPTILHAAGILGLNLAYQGVAARLATWENHRTNHSHELSITYKRFFFEFCDCMASLFFLAFVSADIILLRTELQSLFSVDVFRRLFTEAIIPLVTLKIKAYARRRERERRQKKTDSADDDESIVEQVGMDPYEDFDDFLEQVITLGYVLLFASAFPLASALAAICNAIELRADRLKLIVYQRPAVRHTARSRTIGAWQSLTKLIVVLSVFTNALVFGLSEQSAVWLPDYFVDDEIRAGLGRYVVGIIFGVEHLVATVVILVLWIVPDVPRPVADAVARELYEQKELLKHRLLGEAGHD